MHAGVQNVWVVLAAAGNHAQAASRAGAGAGAGADDDGSMVGKKRTRISKGAAQWLDTRVFNSTAECVAALRGEGWTIWATDLSQASRGALGEGAL